MNSPTPPSEVTTYKALALSLGSVQLLPQRIQHKTRCKRGICATKRRNEGRKWILASVRDFRYCTMNSVQLILYSFPKWENKQGREMLMDFTLLTLKNGGLQSESETNTRLDEWNVIYFVDLVHWHRQQYVCTGWTLMHCAVSDIYLTRSIRQTEMKLID
jgi:hypothetical protein